MNVKFRMPKFGRIQKGNVGSMLRELSLTTLATTISIVLTFGTAAVLEHRQQEENRRLITMMVIGDIYDFECNNKFFETNYDTENMSDGEQLIAYMEMKEVQRFRFDFCNGFRIYIRDRIDFLHDNVNECLKIMGISKDELIDFIINNSK